MLLLYIYIKHYTRNEMFKNRFHASRYLSDFYLLLLLFLLFFLQGF